MPKTVIAAEVTLNSKPAEGSVKSLKAELRDAIASVSEMSDKFGETSVQAAEAAKKAALLKDKIGDAKALTDAFSPDKKFQAFSSAINGVVGGFTALQGAQALFGVKSEELEKTLLKVQGAMALSQGLSAITESIDAFGNLGTVVVSTFNKIRLAIGSTGLGVLVLAIGAVVTALMDYVSQSSKVEDATKRMKKEEEDYKKALEDTTKEIENRNNITEYQLQLDLSNARARGASLKELRKIESDYWYQKRLDAQTDLTDSIEEVERLKGLGYVKGELLDAANKDLQTKREAYYRINQQYNLAIAKQGEEDFNNKKKKVKDNDQLNKLLNAQNELGLEKEKNQLLNKENVTKTLKLLDDNYTDGLIANSQARQKERDQELALDASTFDLTKTFWDEKNKFIQEQTQAIFGAATAIGSIFTQINQNQLADLERSSQDRIKAAGDNKDAILGIENETAIQKNKLLNKQAKQDKAFAIAEAIINTYQAAAQVFARPVPGDPVTSLTVKIATMAAAVAAGIKNVASIRKVPLPGGDSGGPSFSGIGAPIGPQMGATALQQAQINAAGSAAVQAFVLESDVSGNQERIERLNRAARIQ